MKIYSIEARMRRKSAQTRQTPHENSLEAPQSAHWSFGGVEIRAFNSVMDALRSSSSVFSSEQLCESYSLRDCYVTTSGGQLYPKKASIHCFWRFCKSSSQFFVSCNDSVIFGHNSTNSLPSSSSPHITYLHSGVFISIHTCFDDWETFAQQVWCAKEISGFHASFH